MSVMYDMDCMSPHWADVEERGLRDHPIAILPLLLPKNPLKPDGTLVEGTRGILVELVGSGAQGCTVARYRCCVRILLSSKQYLNLIDPDCFKRFHG